MSTPCEQHGADDCECWRWEYFIHAGMSDEEVVRYCRKALWQAERWDAHLRSMLAEPTNPANARVVALRPGPLAELEVRGAEPMAQDGAAR